MSRQNRIQSMALRNHLHPQNTLPTNPAAMYNDGATLHLVLMKASLWPKPSFFLVSESCARLDYRYVPWSMVVMHRNEVDGEREPSGSIRPASATPATVGTIRSLCKHFA
jgi:hypothetical protein